MKNKTVAKSLIACFVATVVLAVLDPALSAAMNEATETLLGIALFTFGIWAIVKLWNLPDAA